MAFKKAERTQAKLKIAMTGPSGSGKTYSALRLAKGLGGKIALIDTENKSASLYSDRFDFDVLEIEPPYTNEKYLAALQEAEKAKYDVLIIDSLSHQWAGEGGLLNKKEQMDARGGNSFANWAKMTPEHEKFKSAIVHSDMHIIGTMRSKTEYAVGEKENGKGTTVKRMGMAPIQRDGMEYEFTVVFDVAINHEAEVSKDRTSLFVGKIFQVTEETGKILSKWVSEGIAVKPPVGESKAASSGITPNPIPKSGVAAVSGTSAAKDAVAPVEGLGEAERTHIVALAKAQGWALTQVADFIKRAWSKGKVQELTKPQYQELTAVMSTQSYFKAIEAFQLIPGDGPDFGNF